MHYCLHGLWYAPSILYRNSGSVVILAQRIISLSASVSASSASVSASSASVSASSASVAASTSSYLSDNGNSESSAYTFRTHNCGELRETHIGEQVVICGWLSRLRMNRFLLLKDRHGEVQAFVRKDDKLTKKLLNTVALESVIKVTGTVSDRGELHRNPKMLTGDVQVDIDSVEVLGAASKQLPFYTFDAVNSNQALAKYRYLHLRNGGMQSVLQFRSKLSHSMRTFLVNKQFTEVETPTLFRRTPGGASEFLVPAPHVHNRGKFFTLPQSPQQFKQLLMIGGLDRYFQFARCYRDESTKPDRQPEFTQVDFELSFTDENGVMALVEQMIHSSWPKSMENVRPSLPIKRMSYSDAMSRYGTDKPDLRFGLPIQRCTDGISRYIISENSASTCGEQWRNELLKNDTINEDVRFFNGDNIPDDVRSLLHPNISVNPPDLVAMSTNSEKLGVVRKTIADSMGLRVLDQFEFVWIVDFPLFTKTAQGTYESCHHPFTAPTEEHMQRVYSNKPHMATARAYDLVLNGVELGGGSIRINDAELQRYVLKTVLGDDTCEMDYFIEALSYGTPPHGGFALGLDRYVALLHSRGDSATPIRDVIAFPKSVVGQVDSMCGAPSVVPANVLKDRFNIQVITETKDKKNDAK